MKKGRLLLGMAGLGAITVAIVLGSAPEPRYNPGNESGATAAIAGAVEYIHMLKANQVTGEIDPAAEHAARIQARSLIGKQALNLNWESIGPSNIGGRTRALLIDKDNSSIVYAASVSGGLYRSSTGGSSWIPVSPVDENLAVVSICQAANGDIYYGTGEFPFLLYGGGGAASTPAFVGGGVFKSTDGGQTFNVLPSTVPVPNTTTHGWAAVGRMAAHPTDPSVIYAATNGGLRRSTDGGQSWTVVLTGLVRDFTMDVNGKLYVTSGNRLMVSPSGDAGSFVQMTNVFPGPTDLPESNGRMRVAVSPQDVNYIYVVQLAADELKGVYRSTDGGANWTKIGTKGAFFDPLCSASSCQGTYDLLFSVSPKNKNQIWLGGITLWTWSSGQWSQVNTTFRSPGNPYYIHADNHEMIFDPENPDVIWVGNDGGLFKSNDHGVTWSERNLEFRTLQFYGFGIGADRSVIGGTQDNGTQLLDVNSTGIPTYSKRLQVNGAFADGGVAKISWLQPSVLFAENQNGDLGRSVDRGESFNAFFETDMITGFTPFSSGFSNWIMPYDLHETVSDTLSVDSVTFAATSVTLSLGFGDNGQTQFSGTLTPHSEAAVFVIDSFRITAGGMEVVSDGVGNLSGDGTGTFDPQTGAFNVDFNTSPVAEIIVFCDIMFPAGSTVIAESKIAGLPYNYTLPQVLNPRDTIMIQDPVQSLMIVGLRSWDMANNIPNSGGIWMTREVHDFSSTPNWWKIGQMNDGVTPLSIEISSDGDVCYIGTTNGQLHRFSNLKAARSDSADIKKFPASTIVQHDMIATFGQTVTGIAIDPDNNDRVVVTLGNYGNSSYVRYSENATSATPTFANKQGMLPAMPVYCATFDKADPNRVILGTELGVYATEDITTGVAVPWTEENNGMAQVAVFAIEQYRTSAASTPEDTLYEGDLFIATHGRSFYRSTTLQTNRPISVRERDLQVVEDKEFLNVYPNPTHGEVKVRVELAQGDDVRISVRDINGRQVMVRNYSRIPAGEHDLKLDLGHLRTGVYLITAQAGSIVRTGKVVLTR